MLKMCFVNKEAICIKLQSTFKLHIYFKKKTMLQPNTNIKANCPSNRI